MKTFVFLLAALALCNAQGLRGGNMHSVGRLPAPVPSARAMELLAQIEASGADDVVEVTDYASLNWPKADKSNPFGSAPWKNKFAPSTKVFKSNKVVEIMKENFSDEVPGIEGVSFQDVFDGLRDGGCPVLVLGGMVRDSLLGKAAKDTDVAFMCPAEKVVEICDSKGWPHSDPKGGYVKIGHESEGAKDQMEGKTADTSLFNPLTYNEFASNTLFFDTTGNGVIVDKPGSGVHDTLSKTIRIAAPKEQWDDWAALGELKKVLRFWKMRVPSKGFTAEPETAAYVFSYVKSKFASEPDVAHKKIRDFFESRMSGLHHDKAVETLDQYRTVMKEDLGAEWYEANMAPYEPQAPSVESAVMTHGGFSRFQRGAPSARVVELLAQIEASGADDVVEVTDYASLNWPKADKSNPFGNAPWKNKFAPSTKVFKSNKVVEIMKENFSDEVPGIEGVSFQDVFDGLRDGGCPVLVLGGMVRDSLLGKAAKDTDVAFMCPAEKVVEICDSKGWPHSDPKGGYVKIGHESEGAKDQMEGKTADTSLFNPLTYNEFASNTLFFDTTGNGVIVDKPGSGVHDTLSKTIRIAAPKEQWDDWAALGELKKVLRFWKMRVPSKGFTAEPETAAYVFSYVKSKFASEPDVAHKKIRDYFESRMSGLHHDKAVETLDQYRTVMKEDLGAEWYEANMAPYEPIPAFEAFSVGSISRFESSIEALEASSGGFDIEEVKDFSTLKWPFKEAPKPWDMPQFAPNLKVYRSETVNRLMDAAAGEQVPGLDVTFQDVYNGLRDNDCPVFIVGGMVRDSIRGKAAKDTDVAYLCPATKVAEICDKFGWAHSAPKHGYIKIGHETEGSKDQMEGKEGKYNLYNELWKNEFACNTLFYDTTGNKVIIDKPGTGVEDTMSSLIRIPGGEDYYMTWFESNGLKTLLRYFKMRVPNKGFHGEETTARFVKAVLLKSLEEKPSETHQAFTTFFESRMAGLDKDKRAQVLIDYSQVIAQDLGKETYDADVKPFEPSCPYDLRTDVEPFVRSFSTAYKTAFGNLSRLLQDTFKDSADELKPTVTGRMKSAAAVHNACIPLMSCADIAGLRIVAWRIADVETIKNAVLGLQGTTLKYSSITDSKNGYRSVDINYHLEERSVYLEIRTPQMTDWADWYSTIKKEAPELVYAGGETQTYAKEVSDYLERVEVVRNTAPACPALLHDSVFASPNALASRITTGCFALHDQLHTVMEASTTAGWQVSETLKELKAGPVEMECGPDFPRYNMDDVRAFIGTFANIYGYALREVSSLIPFGSVTGRLKAPESLYANLPKRCKLLESYKDVVGLRVTVETISDVKKVIEILGKSFGARAVGNPEEFSPEMLGYRSVHMYPKVSLPGSDEKKPIEVQIRTPLMTVWADWGHDLIYKGDISVREDADVQKYMLDLAQYTLDMDKLIDSGLPDCPKELAGVVISKDMISGKQKDGCFHHDLPKATLENCPSANVKLPPAIEPIVV